MPAQLTDTLLSVVVLHSLRSQTCVDYPRVVFQFRLNCHRQKVGDISQLQQPVGFEIERVYGNLRSEKTRTRNHTFLFFAVFQASSVWGSIQSHPSPSRPQLTRVHSILSRAMFRTALKATTPVVANARNVARRSVLRAVCPRPQAAQSILFHQFLPSQLSNPLTCVFLGPLKEYPRHGMLLHKLVPPRR